MFGAAAVAAVLVIGFAKAGADSSEVPATAAVDKAHVYRACADIPGIVYRGQNEWSTQGWVNVANGHQIQAWCSVVSTGG